MSSRPFSERGNFPYPSEIFGRSILDQPLEIWMPEERTSILIMAGQHGEEPETTVILSRALRGLSTQSPDCAVILSANPDGILRGTRGNANGVDLNRNFPVSSWSHKDTSYHWNLESSDERVELSTGEKPRRLNTNRTR